MTDQAAPPMPQPTKEHAALKEKAGTWNVACKFYMDPSQPPMEVEAKETMELVGDFWTLSKYEADMMGMPFVGRATLGYEPHSQKWVSTWIDSMSPVLFHFTGQMEGDVLVMKGEGWNCHVDAMSMYRTTEKRISADEFEFEMFVTMPDGNEMKMMSMRYTRA